MAASDEIGVPAPALAGTRICLLWNPRSMIAEDLMDALAGCGCVTRTLEVRESQRQLGDATVDTFSVGGSDLPGAQLIAVIEEFAPDFVLTVNGQGLDPHCVAQLACELKEVPFVNWYVDDPAFRPASEFDPQARFFSYVVFDQWYLEWLRSKGLRSIFHLPLATNPRRIRTGLACPYSPPAPVVFVGKAGTERSRRIMRGLVGSLAGDPDDLRAILTVEVSRAAAELQRNPGMLILDYLQARSRTAAELEILGQPMVSNMVMAMIESEVSRHLRMGVLNSIKAPLGVVGPDEWQGLLRKATLSGSVPFPLISSVYGRVEINLNISTFQVRCGLNQRIFDVPAAGGFLITDFKEEIEDLFVIDQEVACYRSVEELNDKIDYYLAHPEVAAGVVRAAQNKVLALHTYEQRLGQLVRMLTEHYPERQRFRRGEITSRALPEAWAPRLGIMAEQLRQAGNPELAAKLDPV